MHQHLMLSLVCKLSNGNSYRWSKCVLYCYTAVDVYMRFGVSAQHAALHSSSVSASCCLTHCISCNTFICMNPACLQWDAFGDVLAVLPAGCSFVYTWTASTRDLQKLETDFRVRCQQEGQPQLQKQEVNLARSIQAQHCSYRGRRAADLHAAAGHLLICRHALAGAIAGTLSTQAVLQAMLFVPLAGTSGKSISC
jgi:hypothetical protein